MGRSCDNCGAEAPEGAGFCDNCGMPIPEELPHPDPRRLPGGCPGE